MKKVLFVCVHNSGRSQMAEAFFDQIAQDTAVAISAGTQPASQVNSTVVGAMREIGIEIGDKKPKLLTAEMLENADRVVTMGCSTEKVCPATFVPSEDWQLEDPEGQPVEKVREIRDELQARVAELAGRLS
ncbi:MAG: arsenate reductase ArsC [Dehalococcoidia bacterium]